MVDDVFSLTDDAHACPFAAQVMGMMLRPLSLWHVWYLQSEGNSFFGADPTLEDFASALICCSKSRAEHTAALFDGEYLTEKSGEIAGNWYSLDNESRASHIQAFNDYLIAGMAGPDFWQDTKRDPIKDRLRCPYEWHLALNLMKHNICATEEDAWNYSYNRAVCWATVISEQNGGKDYVDPKDREQAGLVNDND